MAQLKDLIVNGATRLIGDAFAGKIQVTTVSAPTAAGGSTYGAGTSGQVLKTNGTSSYWGAETQELPSVTSSDNGKVLRVTNGTWAAAQLPSASGVSF